jgi:hypothetical protein
MPRNQHCIAQIVSSEGDSAFQPKSAGMAMSSPVSRKKRVPGDVCLFVSHSETHGQQWASSDLIFNWFEGETLLSVIHHPEFLLVLAFWDRLHSNSSHGTQFAFHMHVLSCNTHQNLSCIPQWLPCIHHSHENPRLCKKNKK